MANNTSNVFSSDEDSFEGRPLWRGTAVHIASHSDLNQMPVHQGKPTIPSNDHSDPASQVLTSVELMGKPMEIGPTFRIWQGPLGFDCLVSASPIEHVITRMTDVLSTMREKNQIDFAYKEDESCFRINVFTDKSVVGCAFHVFQMDPAMHEPNSTVVKYQKYSGDSFVSHNFMNETLLNEFNLESKITLKKIRHFMADEDEQCTNEFEEPFPTFEELGLKEEQFDDTWAEDEIQSSAMTSTAQGKEDEMEELEWLDDAMYVLLDKESYEDMLRYSVMELRSAVESKDGFQLVETLFDKYKASVTHELLDTIDGMSDLYLGHQMVLIVRALLLQLQCDKSSYSLSKEDTVSLKKKLCEMNKFWSDSAHLCRPILACIDECLRRV